MMYARPPTLEEDGELRRMTREASGRVRRRAHRIVLSAPRHAVPAWATRFGMSRATVRFWMRRVDASGPAGWSDEPRRGRPRPLGSHALETRLTMRQDAPQHAGYLATFWTVAMRAWALLHRFGVHLSTRAWRDALRELGRRWGRPRLALPRKVAPANARLPWRIATAVVEAGPEAAILSADASRRQRLPLVRAMGHGVGQHGRLPPPGTTVTRARLGALHLRTGRWGDEGRERLRTDDVLRFLEPLLVASPQGPILLLGDHFSRHTAYAVGQWLPTHPRVHLYSLPTYGSPLKPVERLGLQLKTPLAANRL